MFESMLFKPGVKLNPEHKPKYVYLLAYASCVVETWRKVIVVAGSRRDVLTQHIGVTKTNTESSVEQIIHFMQL